MTQTLAGLVQSDQSKINQKVSAATKVADFLDNFCKAVNAATGKETLRCARVHSSERQVPFAYLSVTNKADTVNVQVRSPLSYAFGGPEFVEEERTASYNVSFGTKRHGMLSRVFFGAAREEAAIAINKDYVHIDSSGSSRSVPEGKLVALWGKDCTEHFPLNQMMAEIYSTLPEDVRQKVDFEELAPLAKETVQFNPGPSFP